MKRVIVGHNVPSMAPPPDDEFGRLVGAVRGYMRMLRPDFADAMGTSVTTVERWEEGAIGSVGQPGSEKRQNLIAKLVRESGCPESWFGLSRQSEDLAERVARLERIVAQTLDLPDEQVGPLVEALVRNNLPARGDDEARLLEGLTGG